MDIPHPPARRTQDCLECHNEAQTTIPATHRYYTVSTCETCHGIGRRVLVPHSVAMGDARCPVCHGDPSRDLGMPANHLQYETEECLLCHPVDSADYAKTPPPAGLALSAASTIPHEAGGVFQDCSFCHQVGGRHTLPRNHAIFSTETCLDCHATTAAE